MFLYFLIAAVIQIVWGLTPSASKIVLQYLPVEGYSAIRYTVSSIIFLGYSLFKYRRLKVSVTDLPKLATIGILAYAIDSLGTLYGLQLGGVLNFALASSMNAVITAAVAILILRERVSHRFGLAAAFSIFGGLILFWGKYDVSGFKVSAGSLLLIWGAYIFEALGFVFSKRFKERMPLTEYIGILQAFAAMFMWITAASTSKLPLEITSMQVNGWLALIFVCLFSCCICYFVLYWLLNHIEGHKLAFFDCFHTLAAVVFGAVLFGEPFNAKMWLGGGLLLCAVMIISYRSHRPAIQSDPVLQEGLA